MNHRRMIGTALVLFATFMLAMTSDGTIVSAAEYDKEHTSKARIYVTGHGKVSAVPDIAHVEIGVDIVRDTAAAAQQANNEAMHKITSALAAIGIPKKNIKTSYFSLHAEQRFNRETEISETIGYRAVNQLSITIEDTNLLGQVIDASIAAGANRISSIRYGIKSTAELEKQALEMAIEDATLKAKALASAADVRIVGIASISEGSAGRVYTDGSLKAYGLGSMTEMGTPLERGAAEVTATVQVVFEIQPE